MKKSEQQSEESPARNRPAEWLRLKRASLLADGGPILMMTRYNLAARACGWPNPHLDPTHTITETEFDAALEKAKEL